MRHAAGAALRIEAGGIGGEGGLEDAAALAGRLGELEAGGKRRAAAEEVAAGRSQQAQRHRALQQRPSADERSGSRGRERPERRDGRDAVFGDAILMDAILMFDPGHG